MPVNDRQERGREGGGGREGKNLPHMGPEHHEGARGPEVWLQPVLRVGIVVGYRRKGSTCFNWHLQ